MTDAAGAQPKCGCSVEKGRCWRHGLMPPMQAGAQRVETWEQRPHPSTCAVHDPVMRCDCWPERMAAEIHDLRARLRAVEEQHEQALKVVVEAKDMLAEQLRTVEGERDVILKRDDGLRYYQDRASVYGRMADRERENAETAQAEARRLREALEVPADYIIVSKQVWEAREKALTPPRPVKGFRVLGIKRPEEPDPFD